MSPPEKPSVFQPARWRAGVSGPAGTTSRWLARPWLAVAGVVVVVLAGLWTRHAVNEGLTETLSEQLSTILDAEVAALELWVESKQAVVDRWAGDDDVIAAVAARDPRQIRTELEPMVADDDHRGFLLVDESGVIVATSPNDAYIGRRLTEYARNLLDGVRSGERVLLRPPLGEGIVEGAAPPVIKGSGLAAAITPSLSLGAAVPVEGGDSVDVLLLTIDPASDFTRLLDVARAGASGETYAFDRHGFMLSDSRFESDLRELDLLARPPDGAAYDYTLRLLDPGGDVTKGHRPESWDDLELTEMAAAATGGADGENLSGYRDYRGVDVVGAWRWIEPYGFGVATEIDRREAFRGSRPVNLAVGGLVALLGLATVVFFVSSLSIRSLSKRIEQVQRLGQYTLEESIGEGGMGTVYKARHAMLARPTALKVLRAEALNDDNIKRFEREVQLTSRLTHPNTIEVYDYGRSPDGTFYYAMELIDGVTLAKLLTRSGAAPAARVVHILRQVCGSLEEAHAKGLVHRDIKPLNIMVCRRGLELDVVKVLDFGMVRDVSTPEELQVTSPDLIAGTPPYIAPERIKDTSCLDPRSDLYSLGGVAFNLLTARDVFTGKSAMEIVYKVLNDDPPSLAEHAPAPIPPRLVSLVQRLLARDPDQRPANAREVIDLLDAIDDAGSWTQDDARRWWDEFMAS